MEDGCVKFVFLLHVILIHVSLLVPTVSCICDRACSSPDSAWADLCELSTPDRGCGYYDVTSVTPSAPKELQFRSYPYKSGQVTTLALDITWQLPENVTGLTGFYVHAIKTSSPVGFQYCKMVTFHALRETPSNPSQVTFLVDCLRNVDVDGVYDITVKSLPSGQSITKSHHTLKCVEAPSVANCLVLRGCTDPEVACPAQVPPEDWRAGTPQAKAVYEDNTWIVRVTFDVYPGDLWLTYRVNLFFWKMGMTPNGFSDYVKSNGSSRPITHEFRDVPPGVYRVTVKISEPNLDAIMVKSNNITVREVTPAPKSTERVTTDTTDKTMSLVTTDTTDKTMSFPVHVEVKPSSTSTKNIPGIVGAGVAMAVIILAGLLIWTWQKRKRQRTQSRLKAGSTSEDRPRSNDMSNLVNNIVHTEAVKSMNRQNNSDFYSEQWDECGGDPYQQGSLFTDFSEANCVHMVGSIDPDLLTDIVPIQDGSVISV